MPEEYTEPRPKLNADNDTVKEGNGAVARLVAELQAGWDQHDADISDRHLAADVAWGSPFGATVHGYERLHGLSFSTSTASLQPADRSIQPCPPSARRVHGLPFA